MGTIPDPVIVGGVSLAIGVIICAVAFVVSWLLFGQFADEPCPRCGRFKCDCWKEL